MSKTGRNDPCPCGNGKKYKQCCLLRANIQSTNKRPIILAIPDTIQEAIEHHQAGRLPQAEALYRQILEIKPNHPDALHLLGMIAHQAGSNEIAIEFIRKAIRAKPSEPMYRNNLGMALETLGELDAAAESFREAILLKSDYARAHYNLGNILRAQGKLDAACANYQKALIYQSDYTEAHNNLGNILKDQGRLDESVEHYYQALLLKPDYAEAHNNLGNALKDQRKLDEAIEHYKIAIALQPEYAEAHNNLGNAFKDLKQLDSALACYSKATSIKPDHADAYFNQGNVLKDLKQFDAALESYSKATTIKPDYADAYINRGTLHQELKQFDAAISDFDEAIAIKPIHADAYYNRGNVLKDQGRLDKAAQHYLTALSLNTDYAEAYHNLGIVLKEQGKLEAAVESYHKALLLKPGYAEGHWNKSLLSLLLGDFDKGWKGYEWRWMNVNLKLTPRNFTQPLWLGEEPLVGKTILLHSEQGLGDAIQFCRYAQMVANLGGDVILEVQSPLMSLLANLDGVSQLVAYGDSLPTFDYHCPLLSLPLAFKTSMDSIPASIPYLTADASKVTQWQVKLGTINKPRVGLVWSGNTQHRNDHNRSVLLSELLIHLPDSFQYFSLQKTIRDEDKEILRCYPEILHYGDEFNDFSDTAALCELMDIIISVDTSVAHLAGALGKPVWILLPFIPDWRWLLDRKDSPWYPTAILYRQEKSGDWAEVFVKVKTALLDIVSCIRSDLAFDRNV